MELEEKIKSKVMNLYEIIRTMAFVVSLDSGATRFQMRYRSALK